MKKKIQIKLFQKAGSTVKEIEQGNGIKCLSGVVVAKFR